MHLLAEILATEPFIVSGTSLTEQDLEYYLSFRTEATPRRGRAPSLFISPNHDVVSRSDCARYGLVPVEGTFGEFLEWISTKFPSPPSVAQLIVPNVSALFGENLDPHLLLRFFSNFELVAAADQGLDPHPSAFFYGREPTWAEIQQHVDIDRSETTPIIELARKALDPEGLDGEKLIAILDDPGMGKSTVLKRVAHELAISGQPVLSLRSFDRIDDDAAIVCLRHAARPIVLLVDGLADHVEQLLSILEDTDASKSVVIICADRRYRAAHIDTVLGSLPRLTGELAPFSLVELRQVLERYRNFGLVGEHTALKDPVRFAEKIRSDPIAVGVCRILNDFSPLDTIVASLWGESDPEAHIPFLCVALAQHCYRSGLRYSLLQRILGATQSANSVVNVEVPLKLVDNPVDSAFVITMNTAIGERTLLRMARVRPKLVFAAFVGIADALAPRVNRRAIMRRTPEARLAGRVFDFDSVVKPLLGDAANDFYIKVQASWQWNSRYWEQRALLSSETDLALALQYARHAVAIELHSFPLTTLGKLLFRSMEEKEGGRDVDFEEAFGRLSSAIEIEMRRNRSTVHPFVERSR